MHQRILQKLVRRIQNVEYTRIRMESLFSQGIIVQRDIDSAYEALFLRTVISFEAFLEDLFFTILRGQARYERTRVRLRMVATSPDALRDILLQGDRYSDWLPFQNTEKRAKLYLHNGRPFSDIDDAGRSTLKTITTIRNAIAHSSDYAMSEFQRQVVGSQNLLRPERKPPGFLRARSRSGPNQTRFQIYIAELGRVGNLIC